MSYLVEQLPHCDLLRLSLSTGWFVLSARQVIRSRLSFSFPSVAHRAPVTSCLQDSTPAPDRNLVSRDSVLFLEIPSGRNLLIKTGWDGRKYPKFLGGKKQKISMISANLTLHFVLEREATSVRISAFRQEHWYYAIDHGCFEGRWIDQTFSSCVCQLFKY